MEGHFGVSGQQWGSMEMKNVQSGQYIGIKGLHNPTGSTLWHRGNRFIQQKLGGA